ncbi:LysR substrate-binding domain-containing protein [Aestuariivirga sp.]|uniref:LysR substrate-binding domain-containing protein n=1 Tax=Aestuariivirga sp. TaxID=2650926 RepID=UPI0025BE19BB|nr:LysR substrate-binding domain-containing protein [Aestuariivirga sp.]MCA3556267.1 LysR family transcriptional regulator [Aestuariivirga sp.]
MRHAQLKAFHAVAVHGGFSRAAEALGLTQPAVSDHVRKLEETYGVQLFTRAPSGVALTGMGRKLFAIAERQFEAEAQALELLSRGKTLEEGQLTIGADAAVHILPELARFRLRHPRLSVRLVTGNSAQLVRRLEDFSIDIAITAGRPAEPGFLAKKLRSDRLVAVVQRSSRLAKLREMPFAQLVKLPLILREEGSMTRSLLLEEARRRGLALSGAIEIESREAAREAAAQGLGLAIMSQGELVPDGRLAALAIPDWTTEMEEWMICLKSRSSLHVIRSFFTAEPS